MSVVTIKGMKLEISEIHDHLVKCTKCRKLRQEFHDTLEWHKKALGETETCSNCNGPVHLHNCKLCKASLSKFHLILSSHLIEILVAKMKVF